MSSAEIKRIEGTASEPGWPGTTSQVTVGKLNGGASFDISEALSTRFDSLSRVSACGVALFYLARDLRNGAAGRLVMLKVVTGDVSAQRLSLFHLEAASAQRLSHRNILKAGPPEELNGVHFSVLEHRPQAETLRQLIDREGWLDPRLAIGLIHQIADALEYAHGLNVLHLTIQPENILIDPDGVALLTNFGLQNRDDLAWAQLERSSHCPIHYASPEQAGGKPLDARSDLYSLGVTLYQMLTDRLPVDSEDAVSVRQKHLAQPPIPPHLYRPDIPLPLSAAVTCLLEKDPGRRFQNIASLRAGLDKALSPFETTNEAEPTQADEDFPLDESVLTAILNPPNGDISVPEPPSIAVGTKDDSVSLADDPQLPSQSSISNALDLKNSVKELAERTTSFRSTPARRRKPLMVVVALALMAIIGLLVLGRVDRNRVVNSNSLPLPAVGQPEPAANETPFVKPSSPNPAPAASKASSRRRSIRRRQPAVRRSSTSPRLRQNKRKWRSPRYDHDLYYQYR